MSSGKTLVRMRLNAAMNVISACGYSKGTVSGTTTDTARLMMMVYITTCDMSPPNLPVTTAQAVAVGHIIQSMADSNRTLCRSIQAAAGHVECMAQITAPERRM